MKEPADVPAGRAPPDARELFEHIVESATDFAIFTTDPSGVVTSWNRGAERVLGYGEADILGRCADLIFVPEDRAAGAADSERSKAARHGRAEDERWHLRHDGTRFWGSGVLMRLSEPRTGFVKILRDLTARHLAEERLRENEARLRVLATNVPQLVFRTRSSGERTWGSPQWEDFTGLSDRASRELGWLEAIHPDDRDPTLAAWREAHVAGEYYVEHRIRRSSDGEYRWYQTRARPVHEEPAIGEWVGASTDVHAMHELQDQQKVLLAELQHRTRNLLAVVQSIARQTLRLADSPGEFVDEFESRLRALSRVQGLLARPDPHRIELRALVAAELAAHDNAAEEIRAPGGKICVDGPPVVVAAGPAQALALALHELATNAVKHGALAQPEGRLSVAWHIGGESGEPRVVLDWQESGVQIPLRRKRRRGYGSELIERALPYQLKTETKLEFTADGIHCRIAFPDTESGTEAG